MCAPATITVNNDLTACETSITKWATNDKAAAWVDVVNCLVIAKFLRNDWVNDVLLDLGSEVIKRNGFLVHCADEDGVDTEWLDVTAVLFVLDSDLGLAIWAEEWACAVLADLGEAASEVLGEEVAEWHEFLGFVGGVAEHVALVAGTLEFCVFFAFVNCLGDIWGLLLNGDHDIAGLVVEADAGVIVADFLDGTTDERLEVELGLGCDLTEDEDEAGLCGCLAGDLGVGVLAETFVENCIGDNVAHLIWVALGHALAGEEKTIHARIKVM